MRFKRRIKYGSCENIDIGCKDKTQKGYIGIDIKDFGQNIVWDVTCGLPFPDSSVSKIYTGHFLEHIKDSDLEDLFFEIIRVSKPGAIITIKVPHSSTIEASYLCHLSRWDENKVNGIIRGLAPNLTFELLSMERHGIELIASLEVVK
jgi:predicted SAM-dependent methyltransferase